MNVTDLMDLFGFFIENIEAECLFNSFKPVLRCPPPPLNLYMLFSIAPDELKKTYDLSALSSLILKLKNKSSEIEDENEYAQKYSVRYLITPDWQIIFAPEGAPSQLIPSHREMNHQCLAAGNLYFSHDYNCVTGINNQSGDFKPSMFSIIWTILMLNDSGLKIHDNFFIDLYGEDAEHFHFDLKCDDLTSICDVYGDLKDGLLERIVKDELAQEEAPHTPR